VFVPREHKATCRARFRTGTEALFAVLTDVEAYPSWRADVKSVRWIESIDGKRAFLEEAKHGTVRYAIEASEPPTKLVLRIADDSLPYGGT